jgi:crossover junction endodeoxyribonuclease RuvC
MRYSEGHPKTNFDEKRTCRIFYKKAYKSLMSIQKTIILGIDPGTRITGYGIIEMSSSGYKVLDFGCIRPPVTLSTAERYLIIFNGVESLIKTYSPHALSIETQFVQKNAQSALKLGMAKGVAMVACAKYGLEVFEYAPKKAKMAVVGNGGASKEQVQKMIQILLGLKELPTPEDAADALALAICHANALSFKEKTGGLLHV